MGLETGTYVSDLVSSNPGANDTKSQGDDHLRLIKDVLKNTFPGASKAWYNPTFSASKTANFSVVSTDMNTTFLMNTSGGSFTATLPTLSSGDAGWECYFLKTNTDTDPFFIAPPSGTIQSGDISGLSTTRRAIPGSRTRVFWTGTAWFAERVVQLPVGAIIDCPRSGLPVGYEWANGQTLDSNYPDYYSANGSSYITPDRRGRVAAGKDNMGGSAASRLTSGGSGIDGTTLGAAGGTETHTLSVAQTPNHSHTIAHTHTVANHTHGQRYSTVQGQSGSFSPGNSATSYQDSAGNYNMYSASNATGSDTTSAGGQTTSASSSANSGTSGSGDSHQNTQPTQVTNLIVVVE